MSIPPLPPSGASPPEPDKPSDSDERDKEVARRVKETQMKCDRAWALHRGIDLGRSDFGENVGLDRSPWTPDQKKQLLEKYHTILMSI